MNWIYETNDDNSARFALGQVFDTSGKTLICFGINPSTACPSCLDNTIRKLIAISKNNGYDNWIMLNVYPQRATNPNQLHEQCNESLIAHNLQSIQHGYWRRSSAKWRSDKIYDGGEHNRNMGIRCAARICKCVRIPASNLVGVLYSFA